MEEIKASYLSTENSYWRLGASNGLPLLIELSTFGGVDM